jgi:hypothetical protein
MYTVELLMLKAEPSTEPDRLLQSKTAAFGTPLMTSDPMLLMLTVGSL